MTTFHDRLRHRLRALIQIRGFSLDSLSRAMGVNHSHLSRKLGGPSHSDSRGLTTVDVDQVLAYLGESPAILDAPVISPSDRLVLAWMRHLPEGSSPTPAEVKTFCAPDGKALARLLDQELLEVREDRVYLTPSGLTA